MPTVASTPYPLPRLPQHQHIPSKIMGKASSKPQRHDPIVLQTLPKDPLKALTKSHLSSLPPELRLIIYEHYFAYHRDSLTHPSLLEVCKLIRIEAMPPYRKHLWTIWVAKQDQVYHSVAFYWNPEFKWMGRHRRYEIIESEVQEAKEYANWFIRELKSMEREGLLRGKEQCLGLRVRLDMIDMQMAWFGQSVSIASLEI